MIHQSKAQSPFSNHSRLFWSDSAELKRTVSVLKWGSKESFPTVNALPAKNMRLKPSLPARVEEPSVCLAARLRRVCRRVCLTPL